MFNVFAPWACIDAKYYQNTWLTPINLDNPHQIRDIPEKFYRELFEDATHGCKKNPWIPSLNILKKQFHYLSYFIQNPFKYLSFPIFIIIYY